MNDSVNSTMGVAAYLDAECNLTKLIFTEGVFNIQYDDSLNQAYISFADSTGGIVAEEVIDLPSQSNTRSFMLTRSAASTIGDIIEGIIDGKGKIDKLGTLGDFVSGDWENAFTDLGIDAAAGLIGGVVAGLPGAIAGFAIGEMINYLRDQGDKSDEMGVQLLLGDANVQIYDVKRTGIYTYKVKVVASRLFTSNQNVSFRIGLYVRENFNTVNEKYHSIATERYSVAGDGTIEFDLKTTNANGTYFAVPVLFPYRQYSTGGVTELSGYKRYGGVVKLEGDICQVNSVTPGKCVKNGSDYKFDLKTSASLICTEDVRSWGVDLYVYQVLSDYKEQKVGTIDYPLSTSSYTLSFEGSVPESFLYKEDKHFDMRAVPFAISDRGERVEGDAQTFTLKAEGCGCPDDNHFAKINSIQTKFSFFKYDIYSKNTLRFDLEITGEMCNNIKLGQPYFIIDGKIKKGQYFSTNELTNTFIINECLEFEENEVDIDYANFNIEKNIEVGIISYIPEKGHTNLQPISYNLKYDEKPQLEVIDVSEVDVESRLVYLSDDYSYNKYNSSYELKFKLNGAYWISRIVFNTCRSYYFSNGEWKFGDNNHYKDGPRNTTYSLNGVFLYDDRGWGGHPFEIEHSDYLYAITKDGKIIFEKEFKWGGELDAPTISY